VFSVTWSNRVQNECIVSECRKGAASPIWTCNMLFSLRETNGWLDIFQPPLYNEAGDELVQIQSKLETDELHYKHLAKVNVDEPEESTFLTSGSYVVTTVLKWEGGYIYYVGTEEGLPGNR